MGELVALRWREVDFEGQAIHVRASYTHGALDVPKSGKGRMVPMIDAVATALARLSQREDFVGPDDLVFAGIVGNHLDHSALRRRYVRARERGSAAAALPRSAANVRHACDPYRRPARVAPLDGPRLVQHDGDLLVVQAAGRRRTPAGPGVRGRA